MMVGSSRSGKFCTFIARNDSSPASVSSTNNMAAAMGLWIDQADIHGVCPFSAAPQRRGEDADADADEEVGAVAVPTTCTLSPSLKVGSAGNDAISRLHALQHLNAIAHGAARHTLSWRTWVGQHAVGVAKTVAQHYGALRQCDG